MNLPEFRPGSLGLRLLVIVALAMLLALVVMLWAVLRHVHHESQEVLDVWQVITAKDLLRDVEVMISERRLNDAWLALETTRGLENSWLTHFASSPVLLLFGDHHKGAPPGDRTAVKAYIWLQEQDGKVLLGEPMPGFRSQPGWQHSIVRTLWQNGHRWRVVGVANTENRHRIYVAQRDDLKEYLSREVGHRLFQIQLVVIPLVMLALALGIWRGLRPLSRLSQQIAHRHPANLDPVSLEQVPRELMPLVESLNRLLERLRQALDAERAFTADAAHELRHPLAVVRNLAQVVGAARSETELEECSVLLEESVTRMSRLIDQLLWLARLDAERLRMLARATPLRPVLEQVVSALHPGAQARDMTLAFETPLEAGVRMDLELLEIVLTNLISNAIKYGRRGGRVTIRLNTRRARLLLQVLDDGPGVAPDQLPRLFDRFYRTANARQQRQGSGLGLAIVRRIVELHGLQVWAENHPDGGLQVTVAFGPGLWTVLEQSDSLQNDVSRL